MLLVPAWVQLHNYPSTHRFQQKLSNWEALNRKVLIRLKCGISAKHQEDLANAVPGAIELLLIQVKRATAKSPFLQAKRAQTEAVSTSPRSRSSTPSPGKQKASNRKSSTKLVLSNSEHESASTSFSKLLRMMSDTTEEFEDITKPAQPRSRANTAPAIQPTSLLRTATPRPLTPNYAKPTQSTKAMARPSSDDAKSRTFSFNFPQKVAKTRVPEKLQEDKTHLPSDTNEFQEGSFVYFLSLEALPVGNSSGTVDDQAQVARVIKTLPSGECTLQLYRRVPSLTNKTRSYFVTPHSIDCCSTLLHTVPNMTFDPQTNTCEWSNRPDKESSDIQTTPQATPPEPLQAVVQRYIYTELLARVTFTLVKLAEPIRTKESISLRQCLPCPKFAESFSVPVEPTVFPKVQVSLLFELPERFSR
ncbi:Sperm flagellar protein 1 [Phytophthora citrophthora]|uniref:Sperm flagellar protein 1 n=1 Tax=Phytophthora citrophthora TaxID=4793 RepID=A0AAD9G0R6_9STRA|nr:Sperm flagellar protein 1 [Phytophthora citrophthora]